jgi:hypothetical protein
MRSHCHLDREAEGSFLSSRPEAEGRSGEICERAVSGVCAKVHRPGQESFRPRGPSRYGATSDSRPDVSTPLRFARHDKGGGRFARHDKGGGRFARHDKGGGRFARHDKGGGRFARHDKRRESLRSTWQTAQELFRIRISRNPYKSPRRATAPLLDSASAPAALLPRRRVNE